MDLSEEWPAEFFASPLSAKFSVDWPNKDKGFVNLEVEAENKDGKEKGFSISLPLSEFDFLFRNKELSTSEQRMMARWLYQNVKVKIQGPQKNLKISWPVL
ncbi:hypothetical protein D3C87_1907940 [compost metagenome]